MTSSAISLPRIRLNPENFVENLNQRVRSAFDRFPNLNERCEYLNSCVKTFENAYLKGSSLHPEWRAIQPKAMRAIKQAKAASQDERILLFSKRFALVPSAVGLILSGIEGSWLKTAGFVSMIIASQLLFNYPSKPTETKDLEDTSSLVGGIVQPDSSVPVCLATGMDLEKLFKKESLQLSKEQLENNAPQWDRFHENKKFAYQLLTQGTPILEKEISLEKWSAVPAEIAIRPLFVGNPPSLISEEGVFPYAAGKEHWTANFADADVFFGCGTGLLAQDELQVLERPSLSHVRNWMERGEQPSFSRLDLKGSALLVEGSIRRGALDTGKVFPELPTPPHTLYGRNFSVANKEMIQACLTVDSNPKENNLFLFIAPHISSYLENKPYQKVHLEQLFLNAFTAFSAIKNKDKNAIVHTGNWGCGAFGNDPKTVALIQLAAARMAGIQEIHYYSLGQEKALAKAHHLLNAIFKANPTLTAGQFIDHLAKHAARYGLVYRKGNGT